MLWSLVSNVCVHTAYDVVNPDAHNRWTNDDRIYLFDHSCVQHYGISCTDFLLDYRTDYLLDTPLDNSFPDNFFFDNSF
jgi:hypothetical protein